MIEWDGIFAFLAFGYERTSKAFTRWRFRIASRQMRAQQGIETGVFDFFAVFVAQTSTRMAIEGCWGTLAVAEVSALALALVY